MTDDVDNSPDGVSRKFVVLLVDDQLMVAEKLRRMLEDQADVEFHYCNDPTQAIERATQLQPTVILQDLVMPQMDGIELLKLLRSQPITSTMPIIVLSTKEDPHDKSAAFSAGASDYLVKPPEKIELLARIRAHSRSYINQLERDEAYRRLQELQSELKEKNSALEKLSSLDPLTGIPNRRRFDEFMRNEWQRARRRKSMLSVVLVDVDYFKAYNDHYGHQLGDQALIRVAAAMSSSLNRPADLLARYGGEEFVVVLPDTDYAGAIALADAFRRKVEELNIPHAHSKSAACVTISLGVACCEPTKPDASAEKLLEKADKALYAAKAQGRNRTVSAKDLAKK